MTRTRPSVSALAVIVGGAVALVTIGVTVVLSHSVANQNEALLQNQAEQVTTLLQTALTQTGPPLEAIDAVAHATNDSPSAFASQAGPLTMKPGSTVALVRSGRVLLVSGKGLTAGQALPPALATAVADGHPALFSPEIQTIGGEHLLTFIVGAGRTGTAVIEESVIHPDKTTPTASGPYTHINVALYATPTAHSGQLIITTARPLPFAGSTVSTSVPVGTTKWLVVTEAKSPLAGSWPNAFPWIILVVGLTLAVVLGALTDVLGRRERYAQALVSERTVQLEASQRELVRKERLSAVGEMATMIGHELRNPLGAALNGVYMVRFRLGADISPEVEKNIALVERETTRAASLAEDLTTYMREREPHLESVAFGTAVDEVIESVHPPDGIEVLVEGRAVTLEVDAAQLTQMLTNSLTNAVQAMPDGGSIRIAASGNNGFVEIVVEDSGPGIDPTADGRVFDPFFSTKAQGTGLGLAIVQRAAESHGGTVVLENGTTRGARLVIRLPRVVPEELR